eukprot:3718809-Amphidinium_carterae.1
MHTLRERRKTIQDNSGIPYEEDPLCVRLTCRPQGAHESNEKDELYQDRAKAEKYIRGKPCVLFDMVAELAMWQADLAI